MMTLKKEEKEDGEEMQEDKEEVVSWILLCASR
jgi:hypothetical protein